LTRKKGEKKRGSVESLTAMVGGDNGKGKGDGSITPYTLTSADNPGSLVTHVQMKGTNYEEWAKSMRVALRAKKKLGFVDGTVTKPP